MKKIFAIMLALVLVLAMGASAMAATITVPESNPTVDKDTDNETYTAYKIFDVTKNGSGAYAYTIERTSPWVSVLNTAEQTYVTLTLSADGSKYSVSVNTLNATNVTSFATFLLSNKPTSATSIPLSVGNNEVGNGYYLITSSRGSALALATTDIPVDITEKNQYPSVTKVADKTNATIGATITYTITVTVPATVDKNITVTDTMEAGLTFVAFDQANAYAGSQSGQTLTWTIPASAKGTTVALKYTAYINTPSGEIYGELNSNTVYIEYSEFKSVDVTVNVETYKASFIKIDGTTKAPLSGVTFKLTDADGNEIKVVSQNGNYRVADDATKSAQGYEPATITSGSDGTFVIEGLGNGTYKLVELSTLPGYNPLPAPLSFAIEDGNNLYSLNAEGVEDNNVIENNTGSELPSTGGIGTTIFYVIGGLLMAAAVVLLVTKKKVSSK